MSCLSKNLISKQDLLQPSTSGSRINLPKTKLVNSGNIKKGLIIFIPLSCSAGKHKGKTVHGISQTSYQGNWLEMREQYQNKILPANAPLTPLSAYI